ncbi:MAG: alpha-amylase family glycosyl hydrolase [Myxococcales bacterium]|nr:alpha-amylase family glycosyl hydrolase [Myxococcota bacterium]MDW8281525.1 alpha-amylase family glycosyl hydrolase [Myxococcales bacterium]
MDWRLLPLLLLPLSGCALVTSPENTDGGDLGDVPDGSDGTQGACAPRPPPTDCPVTVRFRPAAPIGKAYLAGEWNGFSTTAQRLEGPDEQGSYWAELRLRPGLYAYKLVVDGVWMLDPGNAYRKYHGGVENSGLRVRNCAGPALRVRPGSVRNERPAQGQGRFSAVLEVLPAAGIDGLCRLSGTLRTPSDRLDAAGRALSATELQLAPDGRTAQVVLTGLADGKYVLRLRPSAGGVEGEDLLLPFWIEPAAFSLRDTPLYMIVTDRFRDGDPTNNPAPLPEVRRAADYQGGDLRGVRDVIAAGYFDERGIRALWLTPWQTQPQGRFRDQSGRYWVAPYHGYWPVKAREVDPRLGGAEALREMVEEAHRHGIRVLMDAVLNHVHIEHEYFGHAQRRGWFRTGCICGTPGCDWTERRLECLFTNYMPDVDWSITEASEQMIADVLWWMETFDLDGLRIDAVKHVEDLAIFNLGVRVRERFGQGGVEVPLVGETAMGWSDTSIEGNRREYETIRRYIGNDGLTGQFDFVLYHAVPYRVFAREDGPNRRFLHADYWTRASLSQFRGADMVNFLGTHDNTRFVTLATYRGQAPGWERDIADHKWEDLPRPPPDQEPYDRLWLAMVYMMTIPGVPLLYYGDEYGEYGGGDPDNRHAMRWQGRSAQEDAQDRRMKVLLKTRAELEGLRRGDTMPVALLQEDVWAYGRPAADPRHSALVVLNRLGMAQNVMVPVPAELGWRTGDRLVDRLSGQTYTAGAVLAVTVPPRGGLILARQ